MKLSFKLFLKFHRGVTLRKFLCSNWFSENDVTYPIIDVNSYWKIQLHIQQLWQLDINISLSLSLTHTFSLFYQFNREVFHVYMLYKVETCIFYFSFTWVMSWKLLNMTKKLIQTLFTVAIIVRFCYQTHQIILSFDMI